MNFVEAITSSANEIGFPSQVAIEQMRLESGNFRSDVIYGPFIGAAGERGLAQFIPATWSQFGNGDPYNPENSLRAWQRYTVYLSGLFNGDLTKILQAYNGGPGNVQRGTVSTRAKNYAATILSNAGQASPVSLPSLPSFSFDSDNSSFSNFSLFGLSPIWSIFTLAVLGGLAVSRLRSDD